MEISVRHQEAREFIASIDDATVKAAVEWATGLAVIAVMRQGDHFDKYNASIVPFDVLLHARVFAEVFKRREKLERILAGDFRDSWLPEPLPEPSAPE